MSIKIFSDARKKKFQLSKFHLIHVQPDRDFFIGKKTSRTYEINVQSEFIHY